MRWSLLPLLALMLMGGVASEEEEEEENYGTAEEEVDSSQADEAPPQAVYVMEHGFLSSDSPSWTPRGTLLLTGAPGRGYEARLSDAKEFVQMKPELQPKMTEAAGKNRYYAVRMYSPEKPKRVLQASIPAKLLADSFEDWHDILEVTVGSSGAPVSLSYRVHNTLGLALFDHTQVHIAEPSKSDGPVVNLNARSAGGSSATGSGGGGEGTDGEPPQAQSFLRKYWYIVIIVLLLLMAGGDDGSSAGGKAKGGGGGGGGRGGGGGGGRGN